MPSPSQHLSAKVCFLALASAFAMIAHAQDASAPPLVEQLNNGKWLSLDEAQSLRDELFYQNAIHVYMTMLPALNVIGMRDGSEATFGAGYNVLPIWKDRMDSRTWVPTPNADVIYSMNYLDLNETGPLVVAAPPNVIGMFTDFLQRTITDCQSARKTDPGSASNFDPLVVHDGERRTGWSWLGLRRPVGRVDFAPRLSFESGF